VEPALVVIFVRTILVAMTILVTMVTILVVIVTVLVVVWSDVILCTILMMCSSGSASCLVIVIVGRIIVGRIIVGRIIVIVVGSRVLIVLEAGGVPVMGIVVVVVVVILTIRRRILRVILRVVECFFSHALLQFLID